MKAIFLAAAAAVMLTVGVAAAVAAPTAEITFSLDTAHCELTIHSSKDISNYSVNGVKTENVNSSTVVLTVANGDVIVVKSGTSTASFTVSGCGPHDPPHDHDGDDDGHDDDNDHDGDHDADDHH